MSEGAKGSTIGAAVGGGVVGAVLTAGALLLAGPQLIGGRLVRDALLKDPQILVDTADALRARQYEPTLAANRAALETPFASSWKGAAKPDVVLVEFHDYACGYCRASNPHIEQLLKEDKGLRVVYRDLPILGPNSVAAARMALAASRQGRFHQFHDTLYGAGRLSPETLAQAAQASGVAPQAAASQDIEAELKKNFELAGRLGASGTPLFVVGDQVINAAPGYDALKKAIADARTRRS